MCNCTKPGFCETHNMYKDKILFEHCQRGEVVIVGKNKIEPPLGKKVINYVVHQVNHAMNGFKLCSKEQIEERTKICNECPLFDKVKKVCLDCGCYMEAKIPHEISKCPLGKW